MAASTGKLETEPQFFENLLDHYDSPTYLFSLSMVPFSDGAKGNYSSPNSTILASSSENKGVLTESGVTGEITIDDVKIENTISVTSGGGSGSTFGIEFVITEILGSNFLDLLDQTAKEMGWGSSYSAIYVLELRFVGHQQVDGESPLAGSKWVWPINIHGMGISITASGATYDCSGVVMTSSAVGHEDGKLTKAVNITADTVDGYFTSLAEQYAAQQMQDKSGVLTVPNEIQFEFDDSFIGTQLGTTRTSRCVPFNGAVGTEIQFPAGTNIMHIIDNIMQSTEQVQRNIDSGKFYKVITDTKAIAVDPKTNAFARKTVYYVRPYGMITPPREKLDVTGISNKILDSVISKVRKRYDYIYTGLNDQVLDLSIDFDFAFFVNLPRNAGLGGTSDSVEQGANDTDLSAKKQVEKAAVEGDGDAMASSSEGKGKVTLTPSAPEPRYSASSIDNTRGTEADGTAGRSKIASIYNHMASGDQVELDLEIKGDPFWLEPRFIDGIWEKSPKEREAILKASVSNPAMYGGDGDTFFYFTCGTPVLKTLYEGATTEGSDESRKTTYGTIGGVYRVITVSSVFSGGKFTQSLNSAREASIVSAPDIFKGVYP